jgi:nicotinamidase/pyrazinamidase
VAGVTFVGLATDYCVAYSALDAAKLGYATTVLLGACRGIDLGGSLARMMDDMRAAGVALED